MTGQETDQSCLVTVSVEVVGALAATAAGVPADGSVLPAGAAGVGAPGAAGTAPAAPGTVTLLEPEEPVAPDAPDAPGAEPPEVPDPADPEWVGAAAAAGTNRPSRCHLPV